METFSVQRSCNTRYCSTLRAASAGHCFPFLRRALPAPYVCTYLRAGAPPRPLKNRDFNYQVVKERMKQSWRGTAKKNSQADLLNKFCVKQGRRVGYLRERGVIYIALKK